MLLMRLAEAGINIVTLADGQVFKAHDADEIQMIMSILALSRGHEESSIKSHRLSAVWENKRRTATEKKLTSIGPAWLLLSADRRSFGVIEDRARIVRRIFEECAAGLGSYAITRRLNDEGILPFGRSKRWVQSYVTKILQNPAVLGEYQPHLKQAGSRIPIGEPIEDYFPPIINRDLYFRAQHGRHLRSKAGGGRKGDGLTNLFTGLAKCGYCGSCMRYINKGAGPKGGKPFLRCRASLEGSQCIPTGWIYEAFETSFFQFVKEVDLPSILAGSEQDAASRSLDEQIVSQTERIRAANDKREKTYELIQSSMPTAFLAEKLAECETNLAGLRRELAVMEEEKASLSAARLNDPADIKALIDRIRSLEADERYLHRSRLAARLKEIIESLSLFVRGSEPEMLTALERMEASERMDNFEQYERNYRSNWLCDDELVSPRFEMKFKTGFGREVVVSRSDPSMLLTAEDRGRIGIMRLQYGDKHLTLVDPARFQK